MKTISIDKTDITNAEVHTKPTPVPNAGEVVISISQFSFTANNITYALLGDSYKYWDFFPFSYSHGVIPVWGFGEVVSSESEGINVGEKIYGYFPMASHLVIKAGHINPYRFKDEMEHRQHLPAIYNYYMRMDNNPNYQERLDYPFMIFMPLYATSFLLAAYLNEENNFGAKQLFLTSASSKTAIALAHLMALNQEIEIIGLTSSRNADFVESLGCYQKVRTYEEVENLDNSKKSTIIDFAGDKELVAKVQSMLIPEVVSTLIVGASHWDKVGTKGISFPAKAEVFFAPTHAQKRQEEWGNREYNQRLTSKMYPFLEWSMKWMEVKNVSGEEDVLRTYREVLDGKSNPKEGIFMRIID